MVAVPVEVVEVEEAVAGMRVGAGAVAAHYLQQPRP
jgi:hypothetical protein